MNDPWRTTGRIRQSLITIRNVWPATITVIHRQASDEPVTGSSASPMPVPAHVLDVRADCHHDLRFYATLILEQVNDGTISGRVDAGSIDSLTGFVDKWAQLFVEQMPDDGDQCAKDMSRHAETLRGMVRGDQMHRYQVGRCPELTVVPLDLIGVDELVQCKGNLWASMRRGDAMLPKSIVCDLDGEHAWEPYQWAALGKRLEAAS